MNRLLFESLDNRDTPAPLSLTSLVPITSAPALSQTPIVARPTPAPARGLQDCENTVFLNQHLSKQTPPLTNLYSQNRGISTNSGNAGGSADPMNGAVGLTITPPPPLEGIEGSDAGGDSFPGLPIDYSFLVCEDDHADHVGEDGNSCEPPAED